MPTPAPDAATGGGVTIYTLADASYFTGLVGLVNSLRLTGNPYAVVALDCGMHEWQRELVSDEVQVVPCPETETDSPFLKKAEISRLAPEGVIAWLDSDIVVTRRLDELLEIARRGRFCAFRDDWDPGVERYFPEWEQLFELQAPVRPQTYVNAGFFAFDVARFPTLLERWAECCRRIPAEGILEGDYPVDPSWAGDQDALNALLMSEVPAGAVESQPTAGMAHVRGMGRVEVVDEKRLAVRDGADEPWMLHYTWRPKPWQPEGWRRVKPDAYVVLLVRSLFGEGAAVTVPASSVPRWLRPGMEGRTWLFLVRAGRKLLFLTGALRRR